MAKLQFKTIDDVLAHASQDTLALNAELCNMTTDDATDTFDDGYRESVRIQRVHGSDDSVAWDFSGFWSMLGYIPKLVSVPVTMFVFWPDAFSGLVMGCIIAIFIPIVK